MFRWELLILAFTGTLCYQTVFAAQEPFLQGPGDLKTIPKWSLQSSEKVNGNISTVSQPSFDSSSWYQVGSRGTIMASLIALGVYNDTELFFSNNLETMVDSSQFSVPWYYREPFNLQPGQGQHYWLQTNGITSKADIYLNGVEVANKDVQAGAYGGHRYDVSKLVKSGNNVLLIRVYPTDYDKDFALGFVDWNPYPPDNGTGIWRDVQMKQTGTVSAGGDLRITTDFQKPVTSIVNVTLKVDVRNNGAQKIDGTVKGMVCDEDGNNPLHISQAFSLKPGEAQTISLNTSIQNPQIWWPRAWGAQSLYKASAEVYVGGKLSDKVSERNFGIRHVTSQVNAHNDTIFSINGRPFQVLGAGYAPDMFLRFDAAKLETQFKYMLDMGMNTVRLEGKQEHPELYDIADRLGLMVLPGWECCDKWEMWQYNEDLTVTLWDDNDYKTANASMRHEAMVTQTHPSVLGFLVGSDYWPNDRAAAIYVQALHDLDWQNPIIASAAKRGYPEILGPSGLKMDGPYDWNSPNYWYGDQLGAAFGFGSELGSGVGTPEIGSLKKFLSQEDMKDLWSHPNMGLYHMSTNVSQFYDRSIYNQALYARYGKPTSFDDYLLKAQMMDYEATKVQYEAYSAKWNAERPATGLIYWMLNNAWPSLHWNLFDYYLHPAGSYYGTKAGSQSELAVLDLVQNAIYLINHSLNVTGSRQITAELIGLDGSLITKKTLSAATNPNTSKKVGNLPAVKKIKGTALLRLILSDTSGATISRNVYWLSGKQDVMDWDNSTWYNTPVTSFADFTALNKMGTASLNVQSSKTQATSSDMQTATVAVENMSSLPAVFIRMNLVNKMGEDVLPVYWSDNYVTLWPKEKLQVRVSYPTGSTAAHIEVSGKNVGTLQMIPIS